MSWLEDAVKRGVAAGLRGEAAIIERLNARDLLEIVDRHAFANAVTREDVCGRGRTKAVAAARRAAMVDMRELGLSLPEIGRLFGRDHTSVLSAVSETRRAKQKVRASAAYRRKVGR